MLTVALRERSTVGIILVTGRCDQTDRIVGWRWARTTTSLPLELRELVVVKNLVAQFDWPAPPPQNASENCHMFSGYCLNVMNHNAGYNNGEAIAYARGVRATAGL